MSYSDLSKMVLLKSIYDKMTDEEKRAYILSRNNDNNTDMLKALNRQGEQLADIHKRVRQHTWLSNFAANIAGNATYDVILRVLGRLLR